MIKISFDFLGMTLMEPMALLFNWVLCVQSILYYSKLGENESSPYEKYWRNFFLFFAVSTFFGGPSHLFYGYLGLMGKIPGWIAGAIAISYIELAVSSESNSEKSKRFDYFIYAKFIATLMMLFVDLNFTWIMVHTAIGLLLILGISSTLSVMKGQAHFKYFLFAILSMIITLPIRLYDINLHLWFNRDDMGHVFMFITLFFFYRGIVERREALLTTDPIL